LIGLVAPDRRTAAFDHVSPSITIATIGVAVM